MGNKINVSVESNTPGFPGIQRNEMKLKAEHRGGGKKVIGNKHNQKSNKINSQFPLFREQGEKSKIKNQKL